LKANQIKSRKHIDRVNSEIKSENFFKQIQKQEEDEQAKFEAEQTDNYNRKGGLVNPQLLKQMVNK
jgi:uncharacterized protein YjaZ